MPPPTINLSAKLAAFDRLWSPKVIAELNGQMVKLVKVEGEYVWHHHADEDELFLVLTGELEIHFRDGVATLSEGELIVVPRGVEHKPVARRPAEILLFEPATTRNTGNVDHAWTVVPESLERI
ncbi:MAG: cupin domain-containing protein [Phycisphaerales bacterium]|nr:MAG: cupin domain-containing protein [Phycisphaerales bacterium]